MFARVIPQSKLPRHLHYFDYSVPEELVAELKPGTLVNIPWKNFFIKGIVQALVESSSFEKVKAIKSIDKRTVVLPYQLDLLDWFAHYYYCSSASALKLFLPDLPKKAGVSRREVVQIPCKRLGSTKNLADIRQDVLTGKDKKFLLFPHNYDYKVKFYLELCEAVSQGGKQILILFPQIYKLDDFYQYLPDQLRAVTALVNADSHVAKNRHFETWKRVQNNEARIVLGTRSAVFAPMVKPELIVVDDAHAEDYKQWDQNPRYETVNVAQQIQALTGCRLILSSLAPRIEDAFQAKEEKYKLISLGEPFQSVKVVDLGEERKRQKRFTYLSDELLDGIVENVAQRKKVVLIVNKKGLYSYFFCEDCGHEALCPQCQMPLVVAANNELVCYHCHHAEAVPLNCPQCGGVKLKKLGLGAGQVESVLREKFGNIVVGFDSENETAIPDNAVVVSTNLNLPERVWANLGLFSFVYIDSLVYLADFNSNYHLFSLLTENLPRLNAGQQVIVQTCFPENPAFKCLPNDYKRLYKQEIEGREPFHYPPFSMAIKLFFQHHDLSVCEREARDLYQKLRGKLDVTEPYLYYHQKVRNRYRYQMVVLSLKQFSLAQENESLKDVPEFWMVDKNPINLL